MRRLIMRKRCRNCGSPLGMKDKYCTVCGTRRGEGRFLPSGNPQEVLYAPPSIKKWKCPGCGNVWAEMSLSRKRYCTKCGALGKLIKEDKSIGLSELLKLSPKEKKLRKKRLLEDKEDM